MSVSIVVNYYNNERALKGLIDNYRALSAARPEFFELLLVDDASPQPVDPICFEGVPNLRVFRLKEDVQWNMPAARNIGALEARNRLILFNDVDHLLEVDELERFVADCEGLPLGKRLTPHRKRPQGVVVEEDPLKPNINCFLIHRQDFFRAGGYEEMFSGHYGQEDKFFRYCCRWNGVEDDWATFRLSAVRGGSTKGLDRDTSHNKPILDTLVALHSAKARNAFCCAYDRVF